MEILSSQSVLDFVRLNGPCLPNDVKKKLGSDTIIIGAILSELIASKKIKVSAMKVGGSPLYFFHGQEFKLQEFHKYLNEKDRQAYDLLKTHRMLNDKEQTPLVRVSLRAIKDFAKPVDVNLNNVTALFWKWYLLPNEMVSQEVKRIMNIPQVEKAAEPATVEIPKEIKPEIKEEKIHPIEKQKVLAEELPKSEFLEQIQGYFSKNRVEVIETNIVKKSSEIDFIIKIPSPVGSLRYFCKARSKKKINHADLSAAYVQGESKKLPILFLMTGELNKKAKGMLNNEFKNMTVQEL